MMTMMATDAYSTSRMKNTSVNANENTGVNGDRNGECQLWMRLNDKPQEMVSVLADIWMGTLSHRSDSDWQSQRSWRTSSEPHTLEFVQAELQLAAARNRAHVGLDLDESESYSSPSGRR